MPSTVLLLSLIVPAYFVKWLVVTLSMKLCFRLLLKKFEHGQLEILTAMLLDFQVVCSVTPCWLVIFRACFSVTSVVEVI
jgi:hypothetical protein